MFESTLLFWYKPIFMAELLIAEWMYTFCLKRRKYYLLRYFFSVVVCFFVAFLFPVPFFNALYSSFMFFVMFIVTVFAMRLCYAEAWSNIVFCALAAYVTRHIAYTFYDLILMTAGINEGLMIGIYGGSSYFRFNVVTAVVYVNCYFLTYWILLILLGSRLRNYEGLVLKNLSFLVLATFIIFIDIVLNAFVVYYSYVSFDRTYLIFLYLYNLVCSLLAFIIQLGMVSRKALEEKLNIVSCLWNKDREQYALAKENVDRVNMLCHDLKYRLRCLDRNERTIDKEELTRMEEVISAYDAKIRTGNDALDVILTEKSLLCRSEKIRFTCMADGAALSFMDDADIYALFGNAVDNAIEASVRVKDPEKRIIGIVAKTAERFLSVSIYNYFETELTFNNGLPITTKKDREVHGYGMRSIALIVEKYGGDLSVSTKDGIFYLNLLFHGTNRSIPNPNSPTRYSKRA